MIYIFGSLANPRIPEITNLLRSHGHDVFSEWFAAGEGADEKWKNYFKALGMGYKEALATDFVNTAFNFDLEHMKKAEVGVLVMPAGRSGHLEIGWMLGQGKRGYILFPDGEPERPDLMSKLATNVFFSVEELINELNASADQLREVGAQDSGLHPSFPSLGFSCACADCQRDRRDSRGNWSLTASEIAEFDKKGWPT